MEYRAAKAGPAAQLALYLLMIAMLLVMAVTGGRLYGALSAGSRQNNTTRAALSYVSARLRAADEAGAVQLKAGPQGEALVLAEPTADSGYETRIYWYDGELLEEYRPTGSGYAPDTAQPIAAVSEFSARWQDGQLVIDAGEDVGQVRVTLHAAQEVQP